MCEAPLRFATGDLFPLDFLLYKGVRPRQNQQDLEYEQQAKLPRVIPDGSIWHFERRGEVGTISDFDTHFHWQARIGHTAYRHIPTHLDILVMVEL
jgi:hypothetical protein